MQPRIAVVTFAWEGDKRIIFDLLESIQSSFRSAAFDVYVTDDASRSYVGNAVANWGQSRNISVTVLRDEQRQGFRGAIDRTVQALEAIANSQTEYDAVLRIDSDALVIRPGLDEAIIEMVRDPRGLYGVLKKMRLRDALALLLDCFPVGVTRRISGRYIEHDYRKIRYRPVWWSSAVVPAIYAGFRFNYVEGSCYVLGGKAPREIKRRKPLSRYSLGRHGLITSEEDVIVTVLCLAAGIAVYEIDRVEESWRNVNSGSRVLNLPELEVPYVVHPMKDNPEGQELRNAIKERFNSSARSTNREEEAPRLGRDC